MGPTYSKQLSNAIIFETWPHRPISFPHLKVKQIHSNHVVQVESWDQMTENIEADGLAFCFRKKEDLSFPTLAIVTADCLPLALLGHKGVVMLHAGWKGLAQEIIKEQKVRNIDPYLAFIGPSIRSCCYQVSPDFRENFKNPECFTTHQQKICFNLQQEATLQLTQAYPHIKVTDSQICTHCQKQFHSFRRDKTTQRNYNLLRVKV